MDREICTWTDCGEVAVGMVSTSSFEDAWVCEEHLGDAIVLDPDRDVWRFYETDEQATA